MVQDSKILQFHWTIKEIYECVMYPAYFPPTNSYLR